MEQITNKMNAPMINTNLLTHFLVTLTQDKADSLDCNPVSIISGMSGFRCNKVQFCEVLLKS